MAQDEYAVWKQLTPAGLPPPPQKHSISTLYKFEVQKSLEKSADGDEDADDAISGLVSTLEVWSHRLVCERAQCVRACLRACI